MYPIVLVYREGSETKQIHVTENTYINHSKIGSYKDPLVFIEEQLNNESKILVVSSEEKWTILNKKTIIRVVSYGKFAKEDLEENIWVF